MNNQNVFKLTRRYYHYAVIQDSQPALFRVHLAPEQLTLLMQVLFNQYPGQWHFSARQIERVFWPMPIGGKSCFLDFDQQVAFKAIHPHIRLHERHDDDMHVPIITDVFNIHVIEEKAYQTYLANHTLNADTKRFLRPSFRKLASFHKANQRCLARLNRLEVTKKAFTRHASFDCTLESTVCFA